MTAELSTSWSMTMAPASRRNNASRSRGVAAGWMRQNRVPGLVYRLSLSLRASMAEVSRWARPRSVGCGPSSFSRELEVERRVPRPEQSFAPTLLRQSHPRNFNDLDGKLANLTGGLANFCSRNGLAPPLGKASLF